MTRRTVYTVTLSAMAVIVGGCAVLGPLKHQTDLSTLVSLHPFSMTSEPGRAMERVEYEPHRYVYLHRSPIITSGNIAAAEAFDVEGGKGLRLYLDYHGNLVWTQASAEYRTRYLAVVVGGRFRCFLQVAGISRVPVITVSGPFSPVEAAALAEAAKVNYKTLSR